MTKNNTPISVTYTGQHLRILVEEYITMQKTSFTFKGACSYILYRAMEEGRTVNKGIFEINQLEHNDCSRVSGILEKIVQEGRITFVPDIYHKR